MLCNAIPYCIILLCYAIRLYYAAMLQYYTIPYHTIPLCYAMLCYAIPATPEQRFPNGGARHSDVPHKWVIEVQVHCS